MSIYCWLYSYLLLGFVGVIIFGWVIKHDQIMMYFFGIFIGVISCLLVAKDVIELIPKDLVTIVKECERDLPHTQHCEVVTTVKVVNNG